MKRLNNIGDTIVEVLIAVMIVGVTIGGAYGVANRSLKSARQAQERGEALKIAEGQLEVIKGLAGGLVEPASGTDVFRDGVFCIDGNQSFNFTATGWGNIKAIEEDPLNEYPEQCQSGFYNVAVQRTAVENDTHQFQVNVRWFSVIGGGKDEVRVIYRIYGGGQ